MNTYTAPNGTNVHDVKSWEVSSHERHVYLLKSCRLCRAEAGTQTDRLIDEKALDALSEAE